MKTDPIRQMLLGITFLLTGISVILPFVGQPTSGGIFTIIYFTFCLLGVLVSLAAYFRIPTGPKQETKGRQGDRSGGQGDGSSVLPTDTPNDLPPSP